MKEDTFDPKISKVHVMSNKSKSMWESILNAKVCKKCDEKNCLQCVDCTTCVDCDC